MNKIIKIKNYYKLIYKIQKILIMKLKVNQMVKMLFIFQLLKHNYKMLNIYY